MVTPRVWSTRQYMLTVVPHGGKLAELGVFAGAFAADLLRCCLPTELHLVDTWSGMVACGDQDGKHVVISDTAKCYDLLRTVYAHERAVVLHRSDTVEAMGRFNDGYFDFVYVDAAHEYEAVLADLQAAAPKTRLLAGHDYCPAFPGVMRAVRETCAAGWALTHVTQDLCPSYILERVS